MLNTSVQSALARVTAKMYRLTQLENEELQRSCGHARLVSESGAEPMYKISFGHEARQGDFEWATLLYTRYTDDGCYLHVFAGESNNSSSEEKLAKRKPDVSFIAKPS